MNALDTVELREDLLKLIAKHHGDVDAIAEDMGKSRRTLERYLTATKLREELDKFGDRHPGPPRGKPRGESVVFAKFMELLKKNDGYFDAQEFAKAIYPDEEWGKEVRVRITRVLIQLRRKGMVVRDGIDHYIVL